MSTSKYLCLFKTLLLSGCFVLAACTPFDFGETAPSDKPIASADPHAPVGAYVDVINYQHDHNYGYELYDLTVPETPAIGGGAVYPLASGGNVNCCIALPKVWRAGMKVKLAWRDYYRAVPDEVGVKQVDTTQDFEIPRYEQPGNLYITFLPEGKVELIVSQVEPGYPNWPGSIKQTPWEYCVAKNGRKACKAVLPKIFSISESKGFCTYVKRIGEDMGLCKSAMTRCIDEYEDQELCTKTLWSEERKE